MANSDMCLEAAQKAYPNNEYLRVAYMLGFNDGFDKAKEQSEVDLEKEFEKYISSKDESGLVLNRAGFINPQTAYKLARHFYEFGLKAKKEE